MLCVSLLFSPKQIRMQADLNKSVIKMFKFPQNGKHAMQNVWSKNSNYVSHTVVAYTPVPTYDIHPSTHDKRHPRYCVKSVRIRSYSGLHFPSFGINTERYSVSLCIYPECGKIRTRITPNTNTFYVEWISLATYNTRESRNTCGKSYNNCLIVHSISFCETGWKSNPRLF